MTDTGSEIECHEHPTVYLGDHDEGWGPRSLRWCCECGCLFEYFGEGRYATLVPLWAKEKLTGMKETIRYLSPRQVTSKSPAPRRLGRGMREIVTPPSKLMEKLFATPSDVKKGGSI